MRSGSGPAPTSASSAATRPANIADLPWQLAFELGGDQRCGASLIGPSWALTAGHCVEDVKLDYLALRAGSSVRGSGGTVIEAAAAFLHQQYDSRTLDFDIAVVQVIHSDT
ncbi:trypsin-3-like [Schistocerca americana]|uniref:trypsin-3-like n=1 Tax=Schistocerca americana TaxID=7009 RepID=UPI001F4F1AC8|nr:trypsin-3-like [Schistocerca americana]